jgi:hypothetical protein
MNTLTKMALGLMSQLKARPAQGESVPTRALPPASQGLATVIRAWIDRAALSSAMGLGADHEVLLAQTVGKPKASTQP